MRYTSAVTVGLFAVLAGDVRADDPVPTQQAKTNGYLRCVEQVDKVARHILSDNDHGSVATWNKTKPDEKMFNAQIVVNYSDGHSIGVLSSSRTRADDCDTAYTTVFHWEKSCNVLRETQFKDWKYYDEVGGLAVLESESGAVSKILMPAGDGCVTVTTEVVYD